MWYWFVNKLPSISSVWYWFVNKLPSISSVCDIDTRMSLYIFAWCYICIRLIWFIVFSTTFSNIMATSFSCGRSRNTPREPLTMVNFITCRCKSSPICLLMTGFCQSLWLDWTLQTHFLSNCLFSIRFYLVWLLASNISFDEFNIYLSHFVFVISTYHLKCCEFESHSWRSVQHYMIKVSDLQ